MSDDRDCGSARRGLDPLARHSCTPAELLRVVRLERATFIAWRDAEGQLVVKELGPEVVEAAIGRDAGCMVAISWDPQVSRHHAELRRVGDAWAIDDDGLSRNGTFVNDEGVDGRRRLMDRDVIRVGATGIAFRTPIADQQTETVPAASPPNIYVSAAQRAVLLELCRPILEGRTRIVTAATNVQIAERLNLSVDTVKQHLRGLFRSFGVSGLPSSQKRTSLARKAVEEGVVSARELRATDRN
jgi:hypothetical protein